VALPDRPDPLLDDDQPLDGRPGPDHAAARPQDSGAGSGASDTASHLPHAAARRAAGRRDRGVRAAAGRTRQAVAAAAPRAEEEEGRRPSVSDELSVEATGETVGEAKWKALRDLERLAPGLDRAAVRFQVVSEGERGLLGVGYSPALVVASTDGAAAPAVSEPRDGESEQATRVRGLVERVAAAIGVPVRVDVSENEEELDVRCSGGDLGLLIGKHGHTIDSLQYVANVVVHRAGGEKHVTIDAAGYRERRRATLESIAVRSGE